MPRYGIVNVTVYVGTPRWRSDIARYQLRFYRVWVESEPGKRKTFHFSASFETARPFGRGNDLPGRTSRSLTRRGDCEHCLAAGLDGYINRPFQDADLFNAVEEFGPTLGRECNAIMFGGLPSESLSSTPCAIHCSDSQLLVKTNGAEYPPVDMGFGHR
jgi:hypothetical protein